MSVLIFFLLGFLVLIASLVIFFLGLDMFHEENVIWKGIGALTIIFSIFLPIGFAYDAYSSYREKKQYLTRDYSCDGIPIQGAQVIKIKKGSKKILPNIHYREDDKREVTRDCYHLSFEEK